MSVVAYVVVAMSLGISNMVLLRQCAEPYPITLSRGLGITFLFASVQAVMFYFGIFIGDVFRFEILEADPDALSVQNAAVALGLFVFVALKIVIPYLYNKKEHPAFDLSNTTAVLAMSVAAGVNVLFVGIGFGFARNYNHHMMFGIIVLGVISFLMSLLGLMYGRQKVNLQPRIWMIMSAILLLGVGIATMINA